MKPITYVNVKKKVGFKPLIIIGAILCTSPIYYPHFCASKLDMPVRSLNGLLPHPCWVYEDLRGCKPKLGEAR
jgi:hypothetical protein